MKQDKSLSFKRSAVLAYVEMRQAWNSTACYHAHSHDEFSFGVIDSGLAKYQNRQQHRQIGRGVTVTINPADVHSCNPQTGNWSYRMLFVDTNWVGQLQRDIIGNEHSDYRPFNDIAQYSTDCYHHFELLFNSLNEPSNPLVAETLLIEYLEQFFIGNKPEKQDPTDIRRVKELITDELDINHSLTDLAKVSGLSRYHLIRSFKHCYDLSPHAYQLDERIKRARILLKSGHSLLDTAHLLGFADQSHLHRNFKKRLAMTPKQYQHYLLS